MRATTIGLSVLAWLVLVIGVALSVPLLLMGTLTLMWTPSRLLVGALVVLVVMLASGGLPLAGVGVSGRSPRAGVALAITGLLAASLLAVASLGARYALPELSAAHVDEPPPPPPGCTARAPSIEPLGSACEVSGGLVTTPCPQGYACTVGAGAATCEIYCQWDCECPAPARCVERSCRR